MVKTTIFKVGELNMVARVVVHALGDRRRTIDADAERHPDGQPVQSIDEAISMPARRNHANQGEQTGTDCQAECHALQVGFYPVDRCIQNACRCAVVGLNLDGRLEGQRVFKCRGSAHNRLLVQRRVPGTTPERKGRCQNYGGNNPDSLVGEQLHAPKLH